LSKIRLFLRKASQPPSWGQRIEAEGASVAAVVLTAVLAVVLAAVVMVLVSLPRNLCLKNGESA
jgi:hypothetical protein